MLTNDEVTKAARIVMLNELPKILQPQFRFDASDKLLLIKEVTKNISRNNSELMKFLGSVTREANDNVGIVIAKNHGIKAHEIPVPERTLVLRLTIRKTLLALIDELKKLTSDSGITQVSISR